jgi:hypothetical protein
VAEKKKKGKPNTNRYGSAVTFYIDEEQKKKLERLAAKRETEIKSPVSVSAYLRYLIDSLVE